MLSTAEIRWFLKGEIPVQVKDWFIGFLDKPNQAPSRTDHYLALSDEGIGIKIREGLLEHKQRIGGVREEWSDRVGELWSDGVCSGMVEHWQKWSFPIDDNAAVREMLKTYPESWMSIEKRRFLRIMEPDDKDMLRTTSYENVKIAACGWELTRLTVKGSPHKWWSMGFEAFGDALKLKDTLEKVCNLVMKDCPFHFELQNSLSYPEWIKRI
jgi:hypothetical protein